MANTTQSADRPDIAIPAPPTMHWTDAGQSDGSTITTWCGRRIRLDRKASQAALSEDHAAWVSCPLCEAAMILAHTSID